MPSLNRRSDALAIINDLRAKKITTTSLDPHERRVVVCYFMDEESGFSNVDIGKLLGITAMQVGRIKKEMLRKGLWELNDLNTPTIALAFIKRKHEFQRKALSKEDYSLAWKIEVDYTDVLIRMGFALEAPKKLDLSVDDKRRALLPTIEAFFRQNTEQTLDQFARVTGLIDEKSLPAAEGGNGKGNGHGSP